MSLTLAEVVSLAPLTVRQWGASSTSPVWKVSPALAVAVGSLVMCATAGTGLVVVSVLASGLAAPPAAPAVVEMRATREATSTTLAAGAWTTYPLSNLVTNTGGGSFSTSTYKYTVGTAGLYLCTGSVRIADSATSRPVGLGIGTSSADGPDVQWQQMGGVRSGASVMRLLRLAVGDAVRLFLYSDGATFATHYYVGSGAGGQSLHLLRVSD